MRQLTSKAVDEKWVGTARLPARRLEDTLELPVVEHVRYVPVLLPYQRKKRKWPWVLAVLGLMCLGCCGGVAAWAKPWVEQYPATVATTAVVAGLTSVDDRTAERIATRLRAAIDTEQLDEARFSMVYAQQPDRLGHLIVFGTTRFVTDPKKDLDAGLAKLVDDLRLTELRDVDAGPLGGRQRCAAGKLDGKALALCAWADHGSMGVGLFPGRTVEASSPILQTIRAAVISR
jgi:hypothetical protein